MGSPSTKVQNTGILCGAIWTPAVRQRFAEISVGLQIQP
jgi:hypothetical protein